MPAERHICASCERLQLERHLVLGDCECRGEEPCGHWVCRSIDACDEARFKREASKRNGDEQEIA